MLERLRKKISDNPIAILLGVFVLHVFFLNVGHDFLHNHEADHHEHEDCPVYHFLAALKSTFVLYIFYILLVVFIISDHFNFIPIFITQINKSIHPIRGPPY